MAIKKTTSPTPLYFAAWDGPRGQVKDLFAVSGRTNDGLTRNAETFSGVPIRGNSAIANNAFEEFLQAGKEYTCPVFALLS